MVYLSIHKDFGSILIQLVCQNSSMQLFCSLGRKMQTGDSSPYGLQISLIFVFSFLLKTATSVLFGFVLGRDQVLWRDKHNAALSLTDWLAFYSVWVHQSRPERQTPILIWRREYRSASRFPVMLLVIEVFSERRFCVLLCLKCIQYGYSSGQKNRP